MGELRIPRQDEASPHEVLARFRRLGDEPSILVNVNMLTEGFDDPKVRTVVLARLTQLWTDAAFAEAQMRGDFLSAMQHEAHGAPLSAQPAVPPSADVVDGRPWGAAYTRCGAARRQRVPEMTGVRSGHLPRERRRHARGVLVGDAGMNSADNRRALALGGGKYILGSRMRAGDEVTTEVLARQGRYKEVRDNLRVKEVVVGDGERRQPQVQG